jgi:hypothetical protein
MLGNLDGRLERVVEAKETSYTDAKSGQVVYAYHRDHHRRRCIRAKLQVQSGDWRCGPRTGRWGCRQNGSGSDERRHSRGPSGETRGSEELATTEFEVESGVLCGQGGEAFSALVCAHAAMIPSSHCGAALDLRALRTRTSRRSKE